MRNEDLDEQFDFGGPTLDHLDLTKAQRPGLKPKRGMGEQRSFTGVADDLVKPSEGPPDLSTSPTYMTGFGK